MPAEETNMLFIIRGIKSDVRDMKKELKDDIRGLSNRIAAVSAEVTTLKNMQLLGGVGNGNTLKSFLVKTLPWAICSLLLGAAAVGYMLATTN